MCYFVSLICVSVVELLVFRISPLQAIALLRIVPGFHMPLKTSTSLLKMSHQKPVHHIGNDQKIKWNIIIRFSWVLIIQTRNNLQCRKKVYIGWMYLQIRSWKVYCSSRRIVQDKYLKSLSILVSENLKRINLNVQLPVCSPSRCKDIDFFTVIL